MPKFNVERTKILRHTLYPSFNTTLSLRYFLLCVCTYYFVTLFCVLFSKIPIDKTSLAKLDISGEGKVTNGTLYLS